MDKTEKTTFEKSSGNVFEDLGFPDAKERYLKVELAFKIAMLVQEKKLKQKNVAVLLGITQPKVSMLLNGKTEGFSIDTLMNMLTKLGQDVEIVVKRKPRSRRPGEIRIRAA